MANVNISDLTAATSVDGNADLLEVKQAAGNRKATPDQLATSIREKTLSTSTYKRPLAPIFRIKATGTGVVQINGRLSDGVTTETLGEMTVTTSGIDYFDLNESVEVRYAVLSGSFSAVEIF
jgi:alpha-D-ribose 1-methylphosphonate 5-triphosphate synthase subunit PhnG